MFNWILVLLVATQFFRPATGQGPVSAPTEFGKPANLPRPSDLSTNDFEKHLFEFVNTREYKKLGWMVDKGVRDTGPFIDGKYYGTHPAVRIFYSPEIMEWLVAGRKERFLMARSSSRNSIMNLRFVMKANRKKNFGPH